MITIKEVFLSLFHNFNIDREEIRDLLFISLIFGFGLAMKNFSTVSTIMQTITYLTIYFGIVFLTFFFFLLGQKSFSAIIRYKSKFKIQIFGVILFAILMYIFGGNLIITGFIYAGMIIGEAFYIARYKFDPKKRKLHPFFFDFTPIEEKRIHLDKTKRRSWASISWSIFYGFFFILLYLTFVIKSPGYAQGLSYMLAAYNFGIFFLIFFMLPIPPFPGIYILFASRTRYIFILSFLVVYSTLIHFFSLLNVIFLTLLISLAILYVYYYHIEIQKF